MENKKPINPIAFPLEYEEYNSVGILCKRQEFGMTLRDYFAAKAMQGLFSSMGEITKSWSQMAKDIPLKEYISNYSYEIADEMLKQRDL
jgi:hypothetical protein